MPLFRLAPRFFCKHYERWDYDQSAARPREGSFAGFAADDF